MTFLLGLMPWWGWILVVLAGVGLAMFPAQAFLLLKRVPLKAWLVLAAILIVFGAYRIGYQVRGTECEEANKAAQEAADKEAKAQEKAAPKVAEEAKEAAKPGMEKRENEIEKTNTIACDVEYPDGVQQAVREAAAAANPVRQDASANSAEADNEERTETD